MRKAAAFLLVIAIVLALGGAAGWHWWTDWRFSQSTDDAYVQSDITRDQPEDRGLYQGGAGPRTTSRSPPARCCSSSTTAISRPRWRRPRRPSRPPRRPSRPMTSRLELQRSMIEQAAGGGRPSAEADLERARARLPALRSSDHQRFRQPAALRDRRGRARKAAAALAQGPRGPGGRAQPARGAAVAARRGRGEAGAGPRQPAPGHERSRQHGDPGAGRRRRRQPRRPGRAICQARDAARRRWCRCRTSMSRPISRRRS